MPEERRASGVVLSRSVADNISLAVLNKLSGIFGLNGPRIRALAQKQVDSLSIKAPNLDALVGQLSGGNQQKVVIGKVARRSGQVFLLLDEPTRGVDVNAKAEI